MIYTVFPPIAAGGVYFFSEVSDPALIGGPTIIGDGVSHVNPKSAERVILRRFKKGP